MLSKAEKNAFMRPDSPTFSSYRSIQAHVVFGTLSKNCRGVGICKVEVNRTDSDDPPACGRRVPVLMKKIAPGIVSLAFHRDELSRSLLDRYFRNLEFPVPEQYVFESTELKALGMSEFTIRAGVYPVRVTAAHYSLELLHDNGEPVATQVVRTSHGRRTGIRQRLVSMYMF